MSPPSEKVGGYVPRVPHQIAPMRFTTRKILMRKLSVYSACVCLLSMQIMGNLNDHEKSYK